MFQSQNPTIQELEQLKQAGKQLDQPMQFYSLHSAGYTLSVNQGKMAPVDGSFKLLGEKHATFAPLGNSKYGYLATTDPETAIFLMNRVLNEKDIVTHETFLDVTTPANVKVEQALQREITAKNTLAAFVEEQERNALKLSEALDEKDQAIRAKENELAELKAKLAAVEASRHAEASKAQVVSTVSAEPPASKPEPAPSKAEKAK